MSLSVFTDCFGNYNLNDVCASMRVCEQAVTWQLFLGVLMSVNSPLTDLVSISCSVSLSLTFPLYVCVSRSPGDDRWHMFNIVPFPSSSNTHTHTFWVSDWKGYRLNSSPSFLVQHKSLSQPKEMIVCVWERKSRGGALTVKMLNINFV